MCEMCEKTVGRLDALEKRAGNIESGQRKMSAKVSRIESRTRAMLGMLSTGDERPKFWHRLPSGKRKQVAALVMWMREHEKFAYVDGTLRLAPCCRAAFVRSHGGYRHWTDRYKYCDSHLPELTAELSACP